MIESGHNLNFKSMNRDIITPGGGGVGRGGGVPIELQSDSTFP